MLNEITVNNKNGDRVLQELKLWGVVRKDFLDRRLQ